MDKKEFMEQVLLADNGGLEVEEVTIVGSGTPAETEYDFYRRIALNGNGEVKIVIVNS